MKRFFNLLSVFILLLAMSAVANAYTVNYDYISEGNEFTSPYYATTENFDGSLLWTWTGSYAVVNGSVSGKYSAPGGVDGVNKDESPYVTVPAPITSGSGSVLVTDLGGTYNYFGLWWGSMDTYNTFTFYNDGAVVLTLTGSAVAIGNADGNQISPSTNHYVNFLNLPDFDSFGLSSSQFAFEIDNIAIGKDPSRVPEPATTLLFGLGLLGLAGLRRLKK